MGFGEKLATAMRFVGNPIVAGIDPRVESLPENLREGFPRTRGGVAEAFGEFGRGVVDAVVGRVAAVKPQAAFFEMYGPEGMKALGDVIDHAKSRGLLVILDGKRNDIGTTAEAYARAYLGEVDLGGESGKSWDADALTINPYLGRDGIQPFLEIANERGRGVFALVRTSNPSAGDFQDLVADGKPVYRHVAERVAAWSEPYRDDSGYSALGAVVGATYPEQLAELRGVMPGVILLVPGYGAQGGKAADVAPAFDENGLGAVINNSRGLSFAYLRKDLASRFGSDWQRAVEFAAVEMGDELATHTRSSRLRKISDATVTEA